MLSAARDSARKARSIRSSDSPSPEQEAGARGRQERVDERVRVGGVARRVEQVERRPCVTLAADGVEVAVDRQLRVAGSLERGVARGRRQRLLAACDRGQAAFAPVVEPGEVEERPGAERSGAIGDGAHDAPRTFRVARLDEVVAELERAPVAIVGGSRGRQPDRQLGELDGGLRRAAPPHLARCLACGMRDRACPAAPCRAPDAARAAPRSSPALPAAGAPAAAPRSSRRRRSPRRTTDAGSAPTRPSP